MVWQKYLQQKSSTRKKAQPYAAPPRGRDEVPEELMAAIRQQQQETGELVPGELQEETAAEDNTQETKAVTAAEEETCEQEAPWSRFFSSHKGPGLVPLAVQGGRVASSSTASSPKIILPLRHRGACDADRVGVGELGPGRGAPPQ